MSKNESLVLHVVALTAASVLSALILDEIRRKREAQA